MDKTTLEKLNYNELKEIVKEYCVSGLGKALIDNGYEGKTIVLGIRPEDIHDEQIFLNQSPDTVVDAEIKVYEMLGAEVFLYFSLDQYEITARVNPRTTARPGDTIKVAFDASKIHLFDKETEQVICN